MPTACSAQRPPTTRSDITCQCIWSQVGGKSYIEPTYIWSQVGSSSIILRTYIYLQVGKWYIMIVNNYIFCWFRWICNPDKTGAWECSEAIRATLEQCQTANPAPTTYSQILVKTLSDTIQLVFQMPTVCPNQNSTRSKPWPRNNCIHDDITPKLSHFVVNGKASKCGPCY